MLDSRAAHVASLERQLASERERLQGAHDAARERAAAMAEKEAEWLDLKMTVQVRIARGWGGVGVGEWVGGW